MAPLTELSETDIRRNASTRQHLLPPMGLRSSPAKPRTSQENDPAHDLPNISMDRNDAGSSSVRPLEMRNDNSQASCRQSSSSESVSTTSRLWGHQPPPPPPDGYRHYGSRSKTPTYGPFQERTADSVRAFRQSSRRPRMRGQRSYAYGFEGFPNHPPVSYGFQTHRSLMTLRGRGDITPFHAQPAFQYPAHHQASSIRAPSPAFSDTHVSLYPPLPLYHRSASAGPGTPSYPAQHEPPFYGTDMNRSVSSLQQFPSPAMSSRGYPTRRSPFPSRSATPIPSAFAGPSLIPNQSWEGHYRKHKSPYVSMAPVYYDYSEPYHHRASPSIATNASVSSLPAHIGHRIPEDEPTTHIRQAQTPFGFMPGSVFNPSELSASPNSTPPSHVKPSHRPPVKESSLTNPNEHNVQMGSASKWSDVNEFPCVDHSVLHRGQQDGSGSKSKLSIRNRSCAGADPFSNEGQNGSAKYQVHPPFINSGSKVSKSSDLVGPKTGQPLSDNSMRQAMSKATSPDQPMINRMGNGQAAKHKLASSFRIDHIIDERPKSSGEVSKADRIGIHCPTPERPISSQSSNMRFRKVLGVDDHVLHPSLAASVPLTENDLRNGTVPIKPVSGPIFTGGVEVFEGNKFDPPANREATSSDTEHEKSTVESLLDHHIESLGLGSGKTDNVEPTLPELRNSTKSTVSLDRDLRPTRLSERLGDIPWRGHVRSATERFESFTSLTSEQRALVPRRLFHGSARVHPVANEKKSSRSNKKDKHRKTPRERPSESWLTLPSNSGTTSENRHSEQMQESESKTNEKLLADAVTTNREPEIKLSAAICHSDSAPHVPALMSKVPSLQVTDPIAQQETPPQAMPHPQFKIKNHSLSASHSNSNAVGNQINPMESEYPTIHAQRSPSDSAIETIPQVADVPQIRAMTGTERSQKTIRPSPSSKSPINQTDLMSKNNGKPSTATPKPQKKPSRHVRPTLGVQSDSKYPRLAAPDLGPSLTPMSFDFSLQSSVAEAPRVQKSSFSADSLDQGLKNSLRKRLNGMGNKFNVSPKASTDRLLAREQSMKSHTRQKKKHGKQNSMQQNGATVGMSDFAYKKRRWMERLRAWWQRQKSRFRGENSGESVDSQQAKRARWSDSNTAKNMFTF